MEWEPAGTLVVCLGTITRSATLDAKGSRRIISVENCRIVGGGEIAGVRHYDEPVRVSIYERKPGTDLWPEEPDKIGAISTRDGLVVTLIAVPEVFADFWKAAEAADGATRNIHFTFKDEQGRSHPLSIIEASLAEVMPQEAEFDKKTGRPFVAIRKHPVVVEVEKMTNQLSGSLQNIVILALVLFFAVSLWKWFVK